MINQKTFNTGKSKKAELTTQYGATMKEKLFQFKDGFRIHLSPHYLHFKMIPLPPPYLYF